jgi:predicted DNA-binding antitoxin AbrB/MazE fold protein
MTITVKAIYENGSLKLLQPLPLREHERVQVTIPTPVEIRAGLDAVERSYR